MNGDSMKEFSKGRAKRKMAIKKNRHSVPEAPKKPEKTKKNETSKRGKATKDKSK